jgi:hypothetical protein
MIRKWKLKWMFIAPAAIVGMLVFAAIASWIVQALWNWLMPGLFGLKEITGVQALGLLALCRILFGGSGFMHGGRSRFRHRLRERWEHMTPEERERLRQGLREHCGPPAAAVEGKPQA